VTFYNIFKLDFNKHNCPKINIFYSLRKKILDEKCLFIFLLQYLFTSILCAKILCVNWALMRDVLLTKLVVRFVLLTSPVVPKIMSKYFHKKSLIPIGSFKPVVDLKLFCLAGNIGPV